MHACVRPQHAALMYQPNHISFTCMFTQTRVFAKRNYTLRQLCNKQQTHNVNVRQTGEIKERERENRIEASSKQASEQVTKKKSRNNHLFSLTSQLRKNSRHRHPALLPTHRPLLFVRTLHPTLRTSLATVHHVGKARPSRKEVKRKFIIHGLVGVHQEDQVA